MEEVLKTAYWYALALAATPIVVGYVLRKIAGKHAPTSYRTDTPEQIAQKAADDDYWRCRQEEDEGGYGHV